MQIKQSIFLAVLLASSGVAFTQSTAAQTTTPARAATNCAPTQTNPQGTVEPGGTTGQRGEQLGDVLAKSDGVLCPPTGIDPEIRAPTPETGNTPVIPPPGSPGGDLSVRPK